MDPQSDLEKQVSDGRSLTVLGGLRVFRSVSAGMVNVAFPFLVLSQLQLGDYLLGGIYAAATIGTALIGLAFGFSADMMGRKASFVVALALLPASAFILAATNSLPALALAAVVGGISATGSLPGGGVGGAAQPIQSALTTELTSRKDRTRYYSLLAFISGVAAAAGAYLAGVAALQQVFIAAGVLGVVSVFMSPFVKMKKTVRKRARLVSGGAIGKFSLTGVLNGLSQGLVTPFLIPFFITVYGVSRPEMALYAGASGVVASFALLLAPRIERTLGFLKGIVTTRGASIVLAVVLPLVRLFPVSLAVYMLLPATRVMALPVQQSAMMDLVAGDERGAAFGINQTARLLSSSAGTYLAGFEFASLELDPAALDIPFGLYAVVLAVNLGLYWGFFRKYRPPPEVTPSLSVGGERP